jgi:hypothetical protein
MKRQAMPQVRHLQKMMQGSIYAQKNGASGESTKVYNWIDISNPPK